MQKIGLLILIGVYVASGFFTLDARADAVRDQQLQLIHSSIGRALDQLQKGISLKFRADLLLGQKAKKYSSIYDLTIKGSSFLNHRSRADGGAFATSFDGIKYMETDGSADRIRLTSRFDKTEACDVASNNPFTYMFQFLVPRQGFVTYANVADSNGWTGFVQKIKAISRDLAGNLVATTSEPDGWQQIITFSSKHHDYPEEIILRFGTTDTVTSVEEWLPPINGKNLDLPQRVTTHYVVNGKPVIPERLAVEPASVSLLSPGTSPAFALRLTPETYVEDLDLFDSADSSSTSIIAPWPQAACRPADFNLTFQDLSGHAHSLRDYRGKTILLNFWATWCGPCMNEMPSLVHLADRLKTNPNVVVLCVSSEDLPTIRKDAMIQGEAAPIYSLSSKLIPDAYDEARRAIPTSYVIDPAGNIVFEYVGSAEWSHGNMDRFLTKLDSTNKVN